MFRHKGKSRTYLHNLRLASMLSCIAGIVNITGVLAVKVLTTNVTGHFAYFSEELFNKRYGVALEFLLFIGAFLVGAFVSNFLIELVSRRRPQISFAFPMAIEILILFVVGIIGRQALLVYANGRLVAYALLFAMGLQNALVTKVSQSVVRTTHLTGLFTDLGIELSQLFFYRKQFEVKQLSRSISLKLAIIGGFFLGCLSGGYLYQKFALGTLLLADLLLVFALFYDNILFRYYQLRRRVKSW